MTCASCGHDNRAAARFCDNCGAAQPRVCAACATPLRPAAKFCDECGRPAAPAAPAEAGRPAVAGAPTGCTPKHLADRILTSRSAIEGERKQVTVVFVDCAGFTELSTRLDRSEERR